MPNEPSDLLDSGGSNSSPNEHGGSHESIYDADRGEHISWDTDEGGEYVQGSGHTVDDRGGRVLDDWDR